MIDILKAKILSWNKNIAKNFHNNLEVDSIEGNYVWENTDDGIYLTRDNSAYFIGFNGAIYKLTDKFYDNDWEMHNLLFRECEKNSIRIDIPRYCDYHNFSGIRFQYSIVDRPNLELGNDFVKELIFGKVNTDYILDFIDDAFEFMKCIQTVSKKNNMLSPSVNLTTMSRARDSIGIFWYDNKKWVLPFDDFVKNSIRDLEDNCDYLNHNSIAVDKQTIMNKARTKWTFDQ